MKFFVVWITNVIDFVFFKKVKIEGSYECLSEDVRLRRRTLFARPTDAISSSIWRHRRLFFHLSFFDLRYLFQSLWFDLYFSGGSSRLFHPILSVPVSLLKKRPKEFATKPRVYSTTPQRSNPVPYRRFFDQTAAAAAAAESLYAPHHSRHENLFFRTETGPHTHSLTHPSIYTNDFTAGYWTLKPFLRNIASASDCLLRSESVFLCLKFLRILWCFAGARAAAVNV